MTRLFAVFDVESVGLHGEGFAVGGVVVDEQGNELTRLYAACHPVMASGADSDRKWLDNNLPPLTYLKHTPIEVRSEFWKWWLEARSQGALLAAECPWPVEARFLDDCIDDRSSVLKPGAREERLIEAPYPLIDVASVRLAAGLDPLSTEPRLERELPKHDPLADARQSARLLLGALIMIDTALVVASEALRP